MIFEPRGFAVRPAQILEQKRDCSHSTLGSEKINTEEQRKVFGPQTSGSESKEAVK